MPKETERFLIRSAKLLTDIRRDTDWTYYSSNFRVEDAVRETDRLFDSQHWKDPDYPQCVRRLFINIARDDPNLALKFVKHVLTQELDLDSERVIQRDPELVTALKEGNSSPPALSVPESISSPLLDLHVLPDDFYVALQEQINKAFRANVLPAVQILSRKFLENLLIDILRRKYGPGQIALYYDTTKGRFQGFETLIRNTESSLPDFTGGPTEFNASLLRRINAFRRQGNSSAHSIELRLDKDTVRRELDELSFLIPVLVRVWTSVGGGVTSNP